MSPARVAGRRRRSLPGGASLVLRALELNLATAAGHDEVALPMEEGHPVIAVLRWKRVKGRLLGLVRWEPDPASSEFPPEWRGESDLGADLVSEGKAWLGSHGGTRARRRASSVSAARRLPAAQVTTPTPGYS